MSSHLSNFNIYSGSIQKNLPELNLFETDYKQIFILKNIIESILNVKQMIDNSKFTLPDEYSYYLDEALEQCNIAEDIIKTAPFLVQRDITMQYEAPVLHPNDQFI